MDNIGPTNNVSLNSVIPKAVLNTILSDNKLNLCHINVQSLCARRLSKFEELKSTFSNSKLDIVCMTESWLGSSISDSMIAIDGYNIVRNDRNRHGGGICVYFKKGLFCRVLKQSVVLSDESQGSTEYLLLEFVNGCDRFFLGVYYNPPNIDCSETLFQHFDEYKLRYRSSFLIGDFNTNLLVNSGRVQRFEEVLSTWSFCNVSFEPTFFHQNGSSLLDLLLTDSSEIVLKFNQISMPGVSSHDLIFCSLDFCKSQSDEAFYYRDYNNCNYTVLNQCFQDTNWENFYSTNNPDCLIEILNEKLLLFHDNCVPVKLYRRRTNPWFDHEIEKTIIERNIAYRNWKRSKTLSDEAHYKTLRNRVVSKIKIAKQNYEKRMFDVGSSSKQLWSNVKKLGVSSKDSTVPVINANADSINDYFSSNFTMIDNDPAIFIPENPEGFRFRNIENPEIINAIFSIDSNAVGLDELPMKFIKIVMPYALPLIHHLFNSILTTSTFPNAWKMVKIIPIKKSANCSDVSNLRPISILSALSKAFEKLIKSQMSDYIANLGLLNDVQSGFRKGHSTETALLKVHDDIARTIDKKGIAVLLLIDFAKAFDRVSHVKLLKKLSYKFGFSRSVASLIKSYLCDRTQAVYFNGVLSTPKRIHSGVPQGSVLGPLLFSIFINDLPAVLKYCCIHLYADDVQIYFCSTNYNVAEISQKVNEDLNRIYCWSQRNLLPINSSKTKAMLITRLNTSFDLPTLTLNNEPIKFVNKVNNLGMVFTSNLCWESHINTQIKKIFGTLKQLSIVSKHLDVQIKLKLFKALIFPHFIYGDFVFSNATQQSTNKLRIALNCCIRYVFNISRLGRVSHLQKQMLGCPFDQFYRYRICTILFRIKSTEKPNYLFSKLIPFRNTRVNNLLIPYHSSHYYSQSLFSRGIVLWNNLPNNIKNSTSKHIFKRDLLIHLNSIN